MLVKSQVQQKCVCLYLFLSTAIALGPRTKRIPAAMDWRRTAAPVAFFALKKKEENYHGFTPISISAKPS